MLYLIILIFAWLFSFFYFKKLLHLWLNACIFWNFLKWQISGPVKITIRICVNLKGYSRKNSIFFAQKIINYAITVMQIYTSSDMAWRWTFSLNWWTIWFLSVNITLFLINSLILLWETINIWKNSILFLHWYYCTVELCIVRFRLSQNTFSTILRWLNLFHTISLTTCIKTVVDLYGYRQVVAVW